MLKPGSKILYIKPNNSSFIRADEQILQKHFAVKSLLLNQAGKKASFIWRLIHLKLFILFNIRKTKALVTWFGDYHAAVMVLMGKIFCIPTIVFAGGQEAICYKELGKGVYQKRFRGWCVKYALRNATMVLPNHQSLIYHENYFYNPEKPHIDGIKHYVKGIKGRIEVVPNGIDQSRIRFDASVIKQANLIMTVGTMNTTADFFNKGYDLFIEVARRNSDLEFVLISVKKSYMDWVEENYKISEIANLKVIQSFCPDDILSHYFNHSKVYVQASITEGMPVSLSEAMICECIPVGSNVNGIPDAIGPCGIIIYKREVAELEAAIRKALTLDTAKQAREYTLANFTMEKREDRLLELLLQK